MYILQRSKVFRQIGLGKQCRPRSNCSSGPSRSSLIRVYTVCHSIGMFWTHYSIVEPHCSNFRNITAIFRVSKVLGTLQYFHSKCNMSKAETPLVLNNKSRIMTKPTKWHVRPAKTQISLGIRPVWSESSLCAQWVVMDTSFLHADSEDSDQTGRMPRLIWVFAGHTCHFVGFVVRRLISL